MKIEWKEVIKVWASRLIKLSAIFRCWGQFERATQHVFSTTLSQRERVTASTGEAGLIPLFYCITSLVDYLIFGSCELMWGILFFHSSYYISGISAENGCRQRSTRYYFASQLIVKRYTIGLSFNAWKYSLLYQREIKLALECPGGFQREKEREGETKNIFFLVHIAATSRAHVRTRRKELHRLSWRILQRENCIYDYKRIRGTRGRANPCVALSFYVGRSFEYLDVDFLAREKKFPRAGHSFRATFKPLNLNIPVSASWELGSKLYDE